MVEDISREWPEHYRRVDVDVMSNFDHRINQSVADQLQAGPLIANYPAWEFHGSVWWDCELSKWCCRVMRYCALVTTVCSDSLKEIMDELSARYGAA